MQHHKPVIHDGRGDTRSDDGSLAASQSLRLPQWLRDLLDEVAATAAPPLALTVDDAGAVAREFIAAGLLKHTLAQYHTPPQITDADRDIPDGGVARPGPLHADLDAHRSIRMPGWLHGHVRDSDIADSAAAAARDLIWLGYQLYDAGAFPYGEPLPPRTDALCPSCWEAGTAGIWQRSFEYPYALDDLFDELSTERENPYRAYIERNYHQHGWDPSAITDPDHPLYGIDRRELGGDHPDVDAVVTVAHCHICDHTDDKAEFVRAYYNEHHKRADPDAAPPANHDQPQTQPQTEFTMTQSTQSSTAQPAETPAYNDLQNILHGQAMAMGESLSGDAADAPDPDPGGKALDAISAGRTVRQDDPELVGDLASLGYSAETAADALDLTVDEVEECAEKRLRELMFLRTDESVLPDDDDLWRLYHILIREEYVDWTNVIGTKDVAEQTGWDSLVAWIEETIEGDDGIDQSTWLAAVEAAIRHEEADTETDD